MLSAPSPALKELTWRRAGRRVIITGRMIPYGELLRRSIANGSGQPPMRRDPGSPGQIEVHLGPLDARDEPERMLERARSKCASGGALPFILDSSAWKSRLVNARLAGCGSRCECAPEVDRSLLTDVPGTRDTSCSHSVTYSNGPNRPACVPPLLLAEHGAVSELWRLRCHWRAQSRSGDARRRTGIAGPG